MKNSPVTLEDIKNPKTPLWKRVMEAIDIFDRMPKDKQEMEINANRDKIRNYLKSLKEERDEILIKRVVG